MAQNSITPIQAIAGTVSTVTPLTVPTTAERALSRSVSAAVQRVNDAGYPGDGREVTFSVDQATKRPVIRVVDTSTKEVIQQWPPEYLLQIAAEVDKLTRDSG
jgi:flagellar protein FlaG